MIKIIVCHWLLVPVEARSICKPRKFVAVKWFVNITRQTTQGLESWKPVNLTTVSLYSDRQKKRKVFC